MKVVVTPSLRAVAAQTLSKHALLCSDAVEACVGFAPTLIVYERCVNRCRGGGLLSGL